jgi:hypothetical protein
MTIEGSICSNVNVCGLAMGNKIGYIYVREPLHLGTGIELKIIE